MIAKNGLIGASLLESFGERHRAATGRVWADAVLNRSNAVSGWFFRDDDFLRWTTPLKTKTVQKTKKKRFLTKKTSSHVFYVMQIAIKRDLRPFKAYLIDFVRLGEVFYFALDLGVF